MTFRRICGYDLNGWLDSAARNWIIEPGGEVLRTGAIVSQTAPLPSVVRAGSEPGGRWVGGVPADLAPHGRGGGWGDVGEAARRIAVRELLRAPQSNIDAVAAAMTGLVPGADCAVVSVDDGPNSSETQRESLLSAAKRTGARRSMLVWRPVLAALWAIETGLVRHEQKVGVICHSGAGFLVQTLEIRKASGRQTELLTPERRRPGEALPSSLGYDALVRCAVDSEVRDRVSLARLALGFASDAEILRAPNGDWVKRHAREALALPLDDIVLNDLRLIKNCDIVLIETLSQGAIREGVINRLSSAVQGACTLLPIEAIARGALVAASRLDAGDPVYFDFLPRIATIVSGTEGPRSFDLIDPEETLPAGKLYRSPTPARLALAQGQERISVYLYKEDQRHPRVAHLDLGKAADRTTPVEVVVEQSPAAGRARILLAMPELGRSLTIDWDASEVLEQSWETVIESLASPAPSVPNRLVLQCSAIHWHNSSTSIGLSNVLSYSATQNAPDWRTLAARMAQRVEDTYAISSDGELPHGLNAGANASLEAVNSKAMVHALAQLSHNGPVDTATLKFLTWQFRHCPNALGERLLEIVEDGALLDRLFPHPSSKKLVYQGLGRILGTEAHESRIFAHLLNKPPEAWNWQRETACVAFILSRSETAPRLLARADVNLLLRRVETELRAYSGPEDTRIRYSIILLVGLLRWRRIEPFALIAGRDVALDSTMILLQGVIERLGRERYRRPWQERLLILLKQTREELLGEGQNPELLHELYNFRGGDRIDFESPENSN